MAASDVRIEPAQPAHAAELAPKLRAAEVAELLAASGREPLPVLLEAVEKSTEAWAVYIHGELACLWGVVKARETVLGGRIGIGWLLTSDAVERYAKTFWWLCLMLIPPLLERWDTLFNAIDSRYVQALGWAKRLGFKLEPPRPMGVAGINFVPFMVSRDCLCASR